MLVSKAGDVHKGHDEACTRGEAGKPFQGDCPVVPAKRAKGCYRLQSVRGFLGAIDGRELLITSSGWFSACFKAVEPLLDVEVEKMPCNKVET